nr:ribulokinase [Oscillospiraceae bacterium]
SCSPMPVYKDGTPLCFAPKWENDRNAYVKLWKHHAAQDKADRLNAVAAERGESWLETYGGKVSSEWMIPKLWQTLDEAPELYADMDYYIEAGDWLVWKLCGRMTRNSTSAGYKTLWSKKDGYPSSGFFAALDPRLADCADTKLAGPVMTMGQRAGGLTAEMAALTGLKEGTPVAVCNVDAHVTMPAFNITRSGQMQAIIGTSTCHMLIDTEYHKVKGICGTVEDGMLPGMFGYEAGQGCVGDHFAWFVNNCLPKSYADEAAARGISPHVLLTEKASALRPGESGLIALDWWNGNRSILVDSQLSGVIAGMTLATKPEEIYRALIEATAFGTREIIENYKRSGVAVNSFTASGGIPNKNPMLVQIYSDVIRLPVRVVHSTQGPALGSAIFGAVAAGSENGGYDDIFSAGAAMGSTDGKTYYPDDGAAAVYDKLYAEYHALHDRYGREDRLLKNLRQIAREAKGV